MLCEKKALQYAYQENRIKQTKTSERQNEEDKKEREKSETKDSLIYEKQKEEKTKQTYTHKTHKHTQTYTDVHVSRRKTASRSGRRSRRITISHTSMCVNDIYMIYSICIHDTYDVVYVYMMKICLFVSLDV